MCSAAHVQCPSASAQPSHLAQRLAVGQRKPRLHRAPLTTRLRARLAVQRQRVTVGVVTNSQAGRTPRTQKPLAYSATDTAGDLISDINQAVAQ